MTMEKLIIDLGETETTIQELHDTANILEETRNKLPIGTARSKAEVFIQELNKEIEWNEQIKEEIESSIRFELAENNRD